MPAMFSLLISVLASAGIKTWNGNVSTDWNNAANWANSGVPKAEDDVIILSSPVGGKMPVINSGTVTIHKLIIENSAMLTQNGGILTPTETISISGSFIQTAGTLSTTKYFTVNSGGSASVDGTYVAKKLTIDRNGNFRFGGLNMSLSDNIENNGTISLNSGTINVTGNINNFSNGTITIAGAEVSSQDHFTNKGLFNISSGNFDLLTAGKKITIEGGTVNQSGGIVSTKDIELKNEGNYNQSGGEFQISHDLKIPAKTNFNGTGGIVRFIGMAGAGSEFKGNVQFYNMSVNTGADYNIEDGDVINISGNFTNNNPSLDNDKGTLIFNGTSPQTIYSASSPATSKTIAANVIISNSPVSLLSEIGIHNSLNIEPNGSIENNGNEIYVSGSIYDVPTPVELVSFNANVNNDVVMLNWTTATETNNFGFEIERSQDSKSWSKIGFVSGIGNSISTNEYSFEDSKLFNNSFYYRLKQVDYNGSFSYSDIVYVTIDNLPSNFTLYQNYPNPFNPTTTIKYSIAEESFVTIKVYNIIGSEIATLVNENLSAGGYEYNFDAYSLSSGAYIYKIQAGSFSETRKMILSK
jgi:hypothetical protein